MKVDKIKEIFSQEMPLSVNKQDEIVQGIFILYPFFMNEPIILATEQDGIFFVSIESLSNHNIPEEELIKLRNLGFGVDQGYLHHFV
jgi:hypothetical protein